jgi:hypothetical protein
MPTYFISKYALTSGILKVEGDVLEADTRYMSRADTGQIYKIGTAAFRDENAARADAQKRVAVRLKTLRRQIAEVESLKIEVTVPPPPAEPAYAEPDPFLQNIMNRGRS